MPAPTISALPPAPVRTDPSTYPLRADNFMAALVNFRNELNAYAAFFGDPLAATVIRGFGVHIINDAVFASGAISFDVAGVGESEINTVILTAPSNFNSNFNLRINGTNRTVRGRNGVPPYSGMIKQGHRYMFARSNGNEFWLLNEVTKADLDALQATITALTTTVASARTDRIASDGLLGSALLTNVAAATSTSITADIDPILVTAGLSASNVRRVDFVSPLTSPGGVNVSLALNGGPAIDIRTRDDSFLPAGALKAGQMATAVRMGSRYRLITEVSSKDLADEIAARIAGDAASLRQMLTVTTASSASEKNANNWITIAPAVRRFVGVAIGSTPDGVAVGGLHTAEVLTEKTVSGLLHTWYDVSGRVFYRRHIDGTWGSWNELVRAADLTALQTSLNATIAALTTKADDAIEIAQEVRANTRYVVQQVDGNKPVRPPVSEWPKAEFLAWDDVSGDMAAGDIWYQMPSPNEPDAPDPAAWAVYDARNGSDIVFDILAVEEQVPALTGIDRFVGLPGQTEEGSANWVALPTPTPGRYIVGGQTLGDHSANIRFRNFVGAGLGSLQKPVKVTSSDITVNLTGPGTLPALRPEAWFNLQGLPTTRGLVLDSAGNARPSHTNSLVRLAYKDYFVTNQFGRLNAVKNIDGVAHVNGIEGLGIALNCNPATGGALMALFKRGGVSIVYNAPGSTSLQVLATMAQNWSYPFAAEFRRVGSLLQAKVDGAVVLSHNLVAGTPQAALTGGYPELYAYVTNTGAVGNTQFAGFIVGHAA